MRVIPLGNSKYVNPPKIEKMFLIILQDSITSADSADHDEAVTVLPSVSLTNVALETPQEPVVRHSTRLAGPSGSASLMPPPSPWVSERLSPKKSKGKEKPRKPKRDEGKKAHRHHLSAQSLVQQVTYNVMPVE